MLSCVNGYVHVKCQDPRDKETLKISELNILISQLSSDPHCISTGEFLCREMPGA